jgi:hypothetical protein
MSGYTDTEEQARHERQREKIKRFMEMYSGPLVRPTTPQLTPIAMAVRHEFRTMDRRKRGHQAG